MGIVHPRLGTGWVGWVRRVAGLDTGGLHPTWGRGVWGGLVHLRGLAVQRPTPHYHIVVS